MNRKLIEIPAGELLEKFGKGSHKPGSGSAAALQGMLAAQMLRTVIEITDKPKRKEIYAQYIPELRRIKHIIESSIYIQLETLFQKDSEQFDKVIKLRKQRDSEKDLQKKRELILEHEENIKVCTEIPLQIAELCLQLGAFGVYVFDHGYKAVRGDSGVGLNSAVAGIAGCLFIVDLNLTSPLPADAWIESTKNSKQNIQNRYDKLLSQVAERRSALRQEAEEELAFQHSLTDFRRGNLSNLNLSHSQIENITRRLQNILWLQKDKIWKKNIPEHPIEVLAPDLVLEKLLYYVYSQPDKLGIYETDSVLDIE